MRFIVFPSIFFCCSAKSIDECLDSCASKLKIGLVGILFEIAAMPCPPSYEEQRFMSLDWELEAIAVSLKRYCKEVGDTISLIDIFLTLNGSPEFHSNLKLSKTNLERLEKIAADQNFAWAEYPKSWPEVDDVARYEAFVATLRQPDQEIELALCEVRTLMFANRHFFLNSAQFSEPEASKRWRIEVARHTKHRKADRNAVLKHHKDQKLFYERRLKEELSPTQRASAQDLRAQIIQKLKAIRAITLDALLSDRHLP
jgi:hypothetical protein